VTWGFALFVVAVAALAAVFPLRRYVKRRLRRRRLEKCEADVAAAVADGRLARATGEALLQHLEGVRRECAGEGGISRENRG